MAYSNETISRARQHLESLNADKVSQYRQRLETVYAKLPRVRDIDVELRRSMVLAAQAVFAGDNGNALEEVKKANLALQDERKKLIEGQFGADFLDESPVCPACGGMGYIGTRMCQCLQELCRQEQKKELSELRCGEGDFCDFRLDYYPERPMPGSTLSLRAIMKKTFQDCRTYAMTFGEHRENLLFSGDTGLGKTFLSACIARCVADQGYSVVYESAVHLFENLEKAKFSGDEAWEKQAQKYVKCDLLIVDDLGTELYGQFVNTALYTLLNDRLLAEKATIISTNLTSEDLEKRYSSQILSRLRGSYRRMAFVGDDIRVRKGRGTDL